MKRVAPVALGAMLLAACAAPLPSATRAPEASSVDRSAPRPNLHIRAETTPSWYVVTLVVNGQSVLSTAGGAIEPTVDVTSLPPLPWFVEARSPSGRTLGSLTVHPGDAGPGNNVAQAIDLSCGRIWLWAGDVPPDAPVPSGAGTIGDCASS